jgi:hypothetical protein
MTAEEQNNLRTFVEGIAVATITKPSARDRQRAPGPSDLADKCDLCVARKIATSLGLGSNTERGFSLKAWMGTAIHEKLERDMPSIYPHAEQEISVDVADIPGIGKVRGHVDVFLPRQKALVDWKGLALDTPLPTPTGWTTMGQVEPGDMLIGSNGKPCEVLGKSEIHDRPCYLIKFDDGQSVVADNEHLWAVLSGEGGREISKVLNTEEIGKTLKLGSGQSRYRIENAAPLELAEADLPLDPYVLGCWLGDGSVGTSRISKPDDEMFRNIERRGFQVGPAAAGTTEKGAPMRSVIGLIGLLKKCGVANKKFIPKAYLRGSRQQRLDLLRGLMDTDGTWNKARSEAVFEVTDEALAMGVYELAVSLGQRPVVNAVQRNGFGKVVTAYTVSFTPASGLNPFLSSVKADRVNVTFEVRGRRRVIKSVDPVETVPTQCIKVDSPDSTYLCTEGMIVTHNTTDMKKLKAYKTQAGPAAYVQNLTAPEREELTKLKALDRASMLAEADMGRMVLLMSRSEGHSGGVPQEYMGQTMLYLYGLRAMGRQADYAVLAFIPRDSNNVSDIWVASCAYRPDVAQGVINRASHLAGLVRAGKIGELEAHPECFPCVIQPRLAR